MKTSSVGSKQGMDVPIEGSEPLPFRISRENTCLVMIDFQGDFVDERNGFVAIMGGSVRDNEEALGPARRVLAAAREARIQVVHTLEAHARDLSDLHESKDRRSRPNPKQKVIGEDGGNGRMLTRGSKCNGLRPEVAWIDGEVAIHKPGKGAFYATELLARLEYMRIHHLIFCGVTTECCVQTTMREANDRGFNCLVVNDATASCLKQFHTEAIGQMTAFGAIIGCAANSDNVVRALKALESPKLEMVAAPPATTALPVIDISALMSMIPLTNGISARQAVTPTILDTARSIGRACRELGFLYIVGHQLEVKPVLDAAKALFALPDPDKLGLKAGAGEGAGYEPAGAQVLDEGRLGEGVDGSQHQADRKESYIIGKSAPSQRLDSNASRLESRWPDLELLQRAGYHDNFQAVLEHYHDQCENLIARGLMRAMALDLGLAADTFDSSTRNSMTKLRLLRYPPGNDAQYKSGAPGAGAHTDWGAITILAQDDVGGLQVNAKPGLWIDAPPLPDTLLVNVGDLMNLWTRGRFRSAPHRVLKPKINAPRYSAALFFNCDHDASIDPHLLEPNQYLNQDNGYSKFDTTNGTQDTYLTAEAYILQRVAGTYH